MQATAVDPPAHGAPGSGWTLRTAGTRVIEGKGCAMLRETRLVAVGVDAEGPSPVLVLQEVDRDDRLLPMWVGLPEATAVSQAWQGVPTARPTTHHLLAALVTAFGRTLRQVRIVALVDAVFHAELVFDAATTVSARPSDALALALHVGVPVLVDDTVLDDAAVPADRIVTPDELEATEEQLDRFRAFLDDVDPEDFTAAP